MATIEELDELSVELINGVGGEEELKESSSSPARVPSDQRRDSETSQTVSAVALPSSQALNEDSDDEDDVKLSYESNLCININALKIGF